MRKKLTSEQISELIKLRKKKSLKELGKIFGYSAEFLRLTIIKNDPSYKPRFKKKSFKGKCYDDYLKEQGLPSQAEYLARERLFWLRRKVNY